MCSEVSLTFKDCNFKSSYFERNGSWKDIPVKLLCQKWLLSQIASKECNLMHFKISESFPTIQLAVPTNGRRIFASRSRIFGIHARFIRTYFSFLKITQSLYSEIL